MMTLQLLLANLEPWHIIVNWALLVGAIIVVIAALLWVGRRQHRHQREHLDHYRENVEQQRAHIQRREQHMARIEQLLERIATAIEKNQGSS